MDILPIQLKGRAQLIADICSRYGKVGSKEEWWGRYRMSEDLKVASWKDDFVDFRRPKAKSASLFLTDVQPAKVRNVKQSDPVELSSRVIDAQTIRVWNAGATTPQSWGPYRGEFEETVSKRHSFENSFNQSLTNTLTVGNDTTYVKDELALTIGFGQTTTDEDEKAERVNRSFEYNGETKPGENEMITAWRKVAKMKQVVTGDGDYEHAIRIGKHWHGSWQGNSHKWDSFANFIRTVKGEAPSDWDLAEQFRKNPVPQLMIDMLEAPLELPYIQDLEFDQATIIDLRKVPLSA